VKAGSEAAFQQQVLNLAGFYGWRGYHTHDSRRSQPGFPDLVLVRGPELIFAELKAARGRVRPDQQEWIAALSAVAAIAHHVDVYVWRPADFDEVHARLARGRTRVAPVYRPEAA
jgi:hypothetical protein